MPDMNSKLSPELSNALNATENQQFVVVDPATNREYVIVDADKLARLESLDAIRNGIAQMESGEGQALPVAFDDIRAEINQRA